MSANITDAIATNGDSVTKQPLIKNMRVIKKETLRLIADWISRSNDNAMVCQCLSTIHTLSTTLIVLHVVTLGIRKLYSSFIGNSIG